MHASVRDELEAWLRTINVKGLKCADLGAYNVNGSVKELVPDAVGFDLLTGDGVDVVIEPGNIPKEHQQQYDVVISISTFQFSVPNPNVFAKEVLQLLKPWGWLFLTMCGPTCAQKHTTPMGEDKIRWYKSQLKRHWAPKIKPVRLYTKKLLIHEDLVFIGRRVT